MKILSKTPLIPFDTLLMLTWHDVARHCVFILVFFPTHVYLCNTSLFLLFLIKIILIIKKNIKILKSFKNKIKNPIWKGSSYKSYSSSSKKRDSFFFSIFVMLFFCNFVFEFTSQFVPHRDFLFFIFVF